MELIKSTNPKLKQRSEQVTNTEGIVIAKKLVIEVNKHSNGVGLSAVQIGIMKRVFVINRNGLITYCINPIINKYGKSTNTRVEGCLNFPKIFIQIERPVKIWVEYFNGRMAVIKKLAGYSARIFQHQMDLINGKCKIGE